MTESVWDYPRPPALVPCERRVRVEVGGETLADTTAALRVLETSHPPTIYLPPGDVRMDLLAPVGRSSFCEWKGNATYFDVVAGDRVERAAAWTYRAPVARYAALKDFISLYPGRMDACYIGEEQVQAQPGDFYGGWITSDVTGPFKGAPGTLGW
ncbi:MAG: DUF427 domain-containing protein [Actinomycetota bacterium]|nr:DUF427 domain-containing protein [Actinomycetota bacterium]